MDQDILRSAPDSHSRLHARDSLEVSQKVLGKLIGMRLVSSIVWEVAKFNGDGLEVVGHSRGILLWYWDSSRLAFAVAIAESLTDEEDGAQQCEARRPHIVHRLTVFKICLSLINQSTASTGNLYSHSIWLPQQPAYEEDHRV